MKSVCFIIESPFPHYAGGIENWLYNVSTRLISNCKVIILSEEPYHYKESLYELPGLITVCNFKSVKKYKFMRFLMRTSFFYYLLSKLQIHRIEKKIIRVNYECGVSNFIALNTMNIACAVSRVRRKLGIHFICSSRGPHAQVLAAQRPLLSKYLCQFELSNMSSADVVWTNGYDMQDYYNNYGISSIVMKNGVDIVGFTKETVSPYNSDEKVIVSVATLLDIKCISELIKAFSIVLEQGVSDYTLYFVGKGDSSKYRELADRLKISDRVKFVGHKTDVRPFLQHSCIIACLSGGGGFSMAALEAMSSGKPVIAWDTPVYRQFCLQKKTMELVPEKDVNELAKGLIRIISNPKDYEEMTFNALQESKSFDWPVIVNDIYTSLK